MAKTRVVDTRFWIDDYICHLDPIEKLLFLYFLTNPLTDISGVYEIPIKHIAVDTGIEKDMVFKILKRFEKDKKIFYVDGWIAVKNFPRYQNTKNQKILAGIKIGLSKAPKLVIDRLSIGNEDLSHLNPNLNSNSNPNSKEWVLEFLSVNQSSIVEEIEKLSKDADGVEILNSLIEEIKKDSTTVDETYRLLDMFGLCINTKK